MKAESKPGSNPEKTLDDASIEENDKKLGQILLDLKFVSTEDLAKALYLQQQLKTEGKGVALKLGQVLVSMKLLRLEDLQNALRLQSSKAKESREFVVDAKRRAAEVARLKAEKAEKKKAEQNRTSFLHRITGVFRKKK